MAITYPTSLDTFTNPTSGDTLASPDHALQHANINDAMEAVQTKLAIGNTIIGTYTAYTPTWTNLTVGNGSVISAYCQVNNLVHFYGVFQFGSTTSIAGSPNFSLPLTAASPWTGYSMPLGLINYHDVSTGGIYEGVGQPLSSGTVVSCKVSNSASTYVQAYNVSATVPFTWVTVDRIHWNLYYRAA